MSGHWRLGVTAFVLFAGLSTLPAFSNPLTDLFNPAPKEDAPPPAPAKEACLPQPGNSTAPGRHWMYHRDGHRKCWFEADEATASLKKPVHHDVTRPAIAPEENEAALHKKTTLDARAQLLSAAAADASQSTAPAPNVVDKAAVPDSGAATIVTAAPAAAEPTIDRLTPDDATQRSVDVEMLLAESSPVEDTAPASPPPPPTRGAPSIPDANEDHWQMMVSRVGMVLIALGFVFLAGSLLAGRLLGPRVAPIRRA